MGDRVWFCNNTTLLKGVRLGNETIVAAGAIVTKSCEENHVILAGNPARIVKRNIWCGWPNVFDAQGSHPTDKNSLFGMPFAGGKCDLEGLFP